MLDLICGTQRELPISSFLKQISYKKHNGCPLFSGLTIYEDDREVFDISSGYKSYFQRDITMNNNS